MTHKTFTRPFAKVYPLCVQKAETKGRTNAEVDQVITWLTGYIKPNSADNPVQEFFAQAPAMNPNRELIGGVVCGVGVEDPAMREIRYTDKLVHELATGKAMEKTPRA
jgi:hypothetical protein